MTTKFKLEKYINHYYDVLDIINNLDHCYLPYVYPSIRKDVKIFNTPEGVKQLKKLIKEAIEYYNKKDINDYTFFLCHLRGHILTTEKFKCSKTCVGCPFGLPPLSKTLTEIYNNTINICNNKN